MFSKDAFATAMNVANVLVFGLILYGVVQHARRTLHVRVMTVAFCLDILMVLIIELSRNAIEQAVGPTSDLMKFHVAVSVLALVFWVLQIVTGRQILRGQPKRPRHRIQAWTFLLLRGANLVTAFMVSA